MIFTILLYNRVVYKLVIVYIISEFPALWPLERFYCLPELCIFGGGCLEADPLYINELDTVNSLLHHKKHVWGSSDSLLSSLHNEHTKLECHLSIPSSPRSHES